MVTRSKAKVQTTSAPEHRSPEHRSPEHRSPEHRSPEHRSPEHSSPEHRSSQRERGIQPVLSALADVRLACDDLNYVLKKAEVTKTINQLMDLHTESKTFQSRLVTVKSMYMYLNQHLEGMLLQKPSDWLHFTVTVYIKAVDLMDQFEQYQNVNTTPYTHHLDVYDELLKSRTQLGAYLSVKLKDIHDPDTIKCQLQRPNEYRKVVKMLNITHYR
jgi:hypothetical protein